MKLSIRVALTESQKAQIVARGEEITDKYIFEMSQKYAAVFPHLRGNYTVSDESIHIVDLNRLIIYNQHGTWDYSVEKDFLSVIADGTLQAGASCDRIMQKISDLVAAKDAEQEERTKKAEEAALKEERERPEREAREAREAEEKRIAQDAEKAEREATQRAESEAARAEKLAWIEAHGSERLQKGIAAGYHCQKIYVTERGNADLGSGYELDYNAKIERKDRSCPTLEALNEAERLTETGIKAKVVWLPRGTETEDEDGYYDCEWTSCEAVEAILLKNYFYKTF